MARPSLSNLSPRRAASDWLLPGSRRLVRTTGVYLAASLVSWGFWLHIRPSTCHLTADHPAATGRLCNQLFHFLPFASYEYRLAIIHGPVHGHIPIAASLFNVLLGYC